MEPFMFRRTGEEDYPRHVKALVLGAPKSGKTTFIATFPNVVVADVEAGLMSIAHLDVPYVTIDSSDKLQTLKFILADDSLRKKAAEQLGLERIETVAVDTLDALQEIMKKERLAREGRTQFEQKDWGWLLDQFREMLRSFMALPLHVVLTCHTRQIQDDEKRVIVEPGLQGSIAQEIAGHVGFSILTDRTREIDPKTGLPYTRYSLQVEGDERHPHLGNRAAGRLTEVIEPDFKHLHAAVFPPDLKLRPSRNVGQVDAGGETSKPTEAGQATQEAAQPVSQPAQSSTPPDEESQPVAEGALQHLQKAYKSWGFALPTNANEWTLGWARSIMRMFVAVNEDVAKGNTQPDEGREQLQDYLQGMNAWEDPDAQVPDGKIQEVMEWVGDDPDRARMALEHEEAKPERGRRTLREGLQAKLGIQPEKADQQEQGQAEEQQASEPEPAPEPAPEPQPEPAPVEAEQTPVQEPSVPAESSQEAQPEVSHDQAVENLKEGLGAQEVTAETMDKAELMRLTDLEQAPPCQETGKPIDDLDIAKLSLSRYDMWLCVEAYLAHMKGQKVSS